MSDSFYLNFYNFFNNPKSFKDVLEIIKYYQNINHLEKAELFKEIENVSKIKDISNHSIS